MKPRPYFHYLCILLLLVAQQSALSHAMWHAMGRAGDDAHAPEQLRDHTSDHSHHHHEEPVHGNRADLCAFDLTFGQMLGGMHGAGPLPIIAELPASIATYVFNPRLGTEAVRATSRGPPRL